MQANYVQRLRLTFTKTGPTRYISHLDLARTLERSLNRARIPVAYTQGFNRRPRMSLAAALPLGYTSEYELADIWLAEAMLPEAAREQMMSKMAPGIEVRHVAEVALSEPALQTATTAAGYVATLLDPLDLPVLQARVDSLMSAESVVRKRKKGRDDKPRPYDLRPLILDLVPSQAEDGAIQLHMRLELKPSATGRPDEVLLALDIDPLAARVHRTQIFLEETSHVQV